MNDATPSDLHELSPSHTKWVTLLEQQLEKDLLKCGITFSFPENTPFSQWIAAFGTYLAALSDATLQQLLYVVDLPENWSKHLMHSEHPNHMLAEAILQREWQKVVFRQRFSSQG